MFWILLRQKLEAAPRASLAHRDLHHPEVKAHPVNGIKKVSVVD